MYFLLIDVYTPWLCSSQRTMADRSLSSPCWSCRNGCKLSSSAACSCIHRALLPACERPFEGILFFFIWLVASHLQLVNYVLPISNCSRISILNPHSKCVRIMLVCISVYHVGASCLQRQEGSIRTP